MGLRIYVAGPISKGNVVKNVRNAIDVAHELLKAGHFPFVPHTTTFTWYFLYINEMSLDDSAWSVWNEKWLKCCDVFLRLPGESAGADKEEETARLAGLQIFHGLEEFKASGWWPK